VGWIDVVYGGVDSNEVEEADCGRDQHCCNRHHRFAMEPNALPPSHRCGTAHCRLGPPPWNNTSATEPAQWDRGPLIPIHYHHCGTANPTRVIIVEPPTTSPTTA
jgi:hypothetical protein